MPQPHRSIAPKRAPEPGPDPAIDPAASAPPAEGFARVELISRSHQRSHAVHLPFYAVHDLVLYEGISFSLEEMLVYATPVMPDASPPPPTLPIGRIVPILLRVELHGFVFEVKLRAKVSARDRRASDRTMTLSYCDLAPAHREALRRIMRSYHTGLVASPAEVLETADDPTFATASGPGSGAGVHPQGAASGTTARRRWNRLSLAASVLVIVASFGYVGVALYDKIAFLPAAFATVTAPRIDLRAAEMGQLDSQLRAAGVQVARDAPLYRISVATLEAAHAEIGARIATLEAATLEAVTAQPLAQPLKLARLDTGPDIGPDIGPDTDAPASAPETAPAPSSALELSLLQGQIKALDLRRAALRGYAPCDCSVQWFQEDGAWVTAGEVVATLARSTPEALRIEALVKLEAAGGLFAGQRALVSQPGSARQFAARIERVSLSPEQQPRVGFPDWLRNEPTLASVLLLPEDGTVLGPGDIGQPFNVVLRRALPFAGPTPEPLATAPQPAPQTAPQPAPPTGSRAAP